MLPGVSSVSSLIARSFIAAECPIPTNPFPFSIQMSLVNLSRNVTRYHARQPEKEAITELGNNSHVYLLTVLDSNDRLCSAKGVRNGLFTIMAHDDVC